jgi:ubiquitin C-terminal hydrolase
MFIRIFLIIICLFSSDCFAASRQDQDDAFLKMRSIYFSYPSNPLVKTVLISLFLSFPPNDSIRQRALTALSSEEQTARTKQILGRIQLALMQAKHPFLTTLEESLSKSLTIIESQKAAVVCPPEADAAQLQGTSFNKQLTGIGQSISKSSDHDLDHALGLKNLGNTCFSNSVLKMLMAHPKMNDFLSEDLDMLEDQDAKKLLGPQELARLEVKKALFQVLKTLKAGEKSLQLGKPVSNQSALEEGLKKFYSKLKAYQRTSNADGGDYLVTDLNGEKKGIGHQIDAHEYWVLLSEILKYPNFFGGVRQADLFSFSGSGTKKSNIQPVAEPGLLVDVSGATIKSVEDAVNAYTRSERMDGVNRPHNPMGALEAADKRTAFVAKPGKEPKQIIVSLNRFRWDETDQTSKKVNKSVVPSESIVFDFFDPDTLDNNKPQVHKKRMNLSAIVGHEGDTGGGHYVAYTYDAAQKVWLKHNDSHVSVLKQGLEANELKTNGYLYLYTAE